MDCYMFFRHIIVDSQPLCSSADLLRFNMEGKSKFKIEKVGLTPNKVVFVRIDDFNYFRNNEVC